MEAFKVVEKSILQFKTKLTEAERDKKSIEVALQGAERQVENQRKYLRQTEDQLVAAKKHIETLKKELEETEKAVKKAEQDGYEVGIVKIDEALRVEVSEVCRIYCLQLWNEFLNQLRPPLPLGHQAPRAPRLTLPLKRQTLAKAALPRPSPLLAFSLKRQNSLRLLKRRRTQIKEWSLMPPSLQLHPRTPQRRKRLPGPGDCPGYPSCACQGHRKG